MTQELLPHLFRTEFGRITAVLCKTFGIKHIEIAEDIAADTFLRALETWPYTGLPANPVAWLYAVAKNKAKNHVSRDLLFEKMIAVQLYQETPVTTEPEVDLSEKNITDSQLQMLFAVCNPVIPATTQIALALRVLCGFGIDEIATAFLTGKETINKRLSRGREKLRLENAPVEFPPTNAIDSRLANVLTTLYLLFSEGYYSESTDHVLRKDLCLDAMRLTRLLLENEQTNLPEVNALYALMCFQASRFEARQDQNGEMILYEQQDETLWDQQLISDGACHLKRSATGDKVSSYHLEAAIAWWYTVRPDTEEKWDNILQLFNRLLQLRYSPVAALNRSYAFSKVHGKAAAIIETEKLNLINNHFYYTLLGVLYKESDHLKSNAHFKKALSLAKTDADRRSIEKNMS